jgi:hypothetical protein
VFNGGSPYNLAVGQSADLREVQAYYNRIHAEAEEERIARSNEGKRSVYE